MENTGSFNRQQIVNDLATFGIKDKYIYLIDIIPLIEMIWCDNKAQRAEIALLEDFLKQHVKRINELANYEVFTYDEAKEFALKFLDKRPDQGILKILRGFIEPLRLDAATPEQRQMIKDSLLAACIDIAASAVVKYPYGIHERFNSQEKKCFFEILESIK